MFNQARVIRIDALQKELSNIKTSADALSISQKTLRVTHLTEKSLKKRVAAKRKDLILELVNLLGNLHHRKDNNSALSVKLYAAIVSYQFFKKSIPIEIRSDLFEKNLQKLTENLSRTETVRNNNMKFKWE